MIFDPAVIEKQRNGNFAYQRRVKEETFAAYGGKCARCGYSENIHALCLDHINDDPEPELASLYKTCRGGIGLYIRLRQEGFPQGRFQVLCYNCNAIKQQERWEANRSKKEYVPRGPKALTRKSSSGIVGVEWKTDKTRWRAGIGSTRVNGKHLGYFPHTEDGVWTAAMAYRAAALEMYGSDAELQSDEEILAAIDKIDFSKTPCGSPLKPSRQEWRLLLIGKPHPKRANLNPSKEV